MMSGAALNCDFQGTVAFLQLDEPARGYPYQYGVYLPPCYETQLDRLYPILYHVPGRGGSYKDFVEVGGTALADDMILSGEVPPFIIVTTENTDSESEKNAESILTDLVPFIQINYRVNPDRRFHAAFGTSLGGVATYRMVFARPDYFSSAALFGSGVIVGEEDRVREWLQAIPPEDDLRVFFDAGEGDPYMLSRAKDLAGMLDEFGIPYLFHAGEGDHRYGYWMEQMPMYFRWVAEDW